MARSFMTWLFGLFGTNKSAAEPAVSVREPAYITTLAPQRRRAEPAARDWFWTIIEASVDKDEDAQIGKLRAVLVGLPDQDLVDFIGLYNGVHAELYMLRLWAAAYVINGGCSDDGFIDFRAWLIAQGRVATERAAADPDSLADLGVECDSATFEEFGYVMYGAFQARSGGAYPAFDSEDAPPDNTRPEWNFDFDDHELMSERLPRLSALYP